MTWTLLEADPAHSVFLVVMPHLLQVVVLIAFVTDH